MSERRIERVLGLLSGIAIIVAGIFYVVVWVVSVESRFSEIHSDLTHKFEAIEKDIAEDRVILMQQMKP